MPLTLADLRPEVAAYAIAMEEALRRHDAERGTSWKTMEDADLMDLLAEHADKLWAHICDGSTKVRMLRDAAAVGNFAMMIADASGALPLVPCDPCGFELPPDSRRPSPSSKGGSGTSSDSDS